MHVLPVHVDGHGPGQLLPPVQRVGGIDCGQLPAGAQLEMVHPVQHRGSGPDGGKDGADLLILIIEVQQVPSFHIHIFRDAGDLPGGRIKVDRHAVLVVNLDSLGDLVQGALHQEFPVSRLFHQKDRAVLPHREMQITEDIKVLCDGASTEGTENRGKVLNAAHTGNLAITYKTLLAMKQAERREAISNAQVVYIYHNAIDAVGDKAATEDQVFEACEQAIREIKNLVRMITNDMNGTHILITADHGFLYSYKPLEESDKAEKSFVSGHIVELDRRYVIADGDCTADHMLRVPMTRYQSGYTLFAPQENIRMKKQGGGMNFVHGGISLQEMVVPVIEFQNMRASSKKFVDVKKAELQLISQSRKVSNSIFSLDFYQKDAVSGKVAAATYEVYMADASGMTVSDKAKDRNSAMRWQPYSL